MPVKSVEDYLEKHSNWKEELLSLHQMISSTELKTSIKWGGPVYTLNNKNVIGIAAFQTHCALWFFQGALMQENTALLTNAQENKTKALRQIRFSKEDKIDIDLLTPYILEAIANQKAGKYILPDRSKKKLVIPFELMAAFKKDPHLKKTFGKSTEGKQREFADHISSAKKEDTRNRRLEKCILLINKGESLFGKYK